MGVEAQTDEEATPVVSSHQGLLGPETPGVMRTVIGRYLVFGELGRGGMGVVLRAYDPRLQREVALKVLRPNLFDDRAQARLVREARAMAKVNHPNVVAVYDVDRDGDEGVVIAMEYVAGQTLRQWLSGAEHPWRAIVEAFVAAGHGLAAAHAEGVLHRDFKFDNVLVASDGRVRVTDFGLARMENVASSSDGGAGSSDGDPRSHDSESEVLTEGGTVMGTPPYMPPEQMRGAKVDARGDQYAFCVGLWRALTTAWPFEGRGRALLAAKRSGPPAWPLQVAVPSHVVEAIRRGLRPEPDDRWPSMRELLTALERDPTRRRRRWAAAGVVVALGLGTGGFELVRRQRVGEACLAEGERIAAVWNPTRAAEIGAAFEATGISYAADTWQRAQSQLDAYVDDWISVRVEVCRAVELDGSATPETAAASRACLDDHRERLDALLAQLAEPDPTVVRKTATAAVTLPPASACTDATRPRPIDPPDEADDLRVADLRHRLAQAEGAAAAGRFEAALELAEAVLDEATALDWPPLRAEARVVVAQARSDLGRYEDAATQLEEAFHDAASSGRDELALAAAIGLAEIVGYDLARHDDGLRWARLAQTLLTRLGHDDDLAAAPLYMNVGAVRNAKGDYAEALAAAERALAIFEATHGGHHPAIANALELVGNIQQNRGAHAEALAAFERALELWERTVGPDHPDLASSLANVTAVHSSMGDYAKGLERGERALQIWEHAFGPEHPSVAAALNNAGDLLNSLGRHDEALASHHRALAIWEQAFGPEHPNVAAATHNIGMTHFSKGEYDEALPWLQRALGIAKKTLGPRHTGVALALSGIGTVQRARGDLAAARASFEEALAIWEELHGSDHSYVGLALDKLGEIYLADGELSRAVEAYERALRIRGAGAVPPHDLATTRFGLARALWQSGGDRQRARELAVAAEETFAGLRDDYPEPHAEVSQWLAAHAQ